MNNIKSFGVAGSAPTGMQERGPSSLGVNIEALAAETDRLTDTVGMLTDRLSPIRVPRPEGGVGLIKEKSVALSPYAETLHGLATKIAMIREQLLHLVNEIEL